MGALALRKAAVLGATGPTGYHLVQALRAAGLEVRVVSRSREHLDHCFPDAGDMEKTAADLADAAGAVEAVAGCDVAFHCVGLPGDKMHLHPVLARNVAAAAREKFVRCLHVSSFWSYLPLLRVPLDESHPREGGGDWIRLRRSAEDILLASGAGILNLPDFYGPRVHTSTLQQALGEALAGKKINWIGSAATPREYVFVPDAMATAARLAFEEAAYGERWIVAGAGPITGEEVAATAARLLGRPVGIRAAGMALLRLVGLFNRQLRGFLPMVPEYMKAIRYDASRLRRLVPDPPVTPYEEGIRRTLESMEPR